jgi:hypothetical protein
MARRYHVAYEDDEWEVRLGPMGEVVFAHEYMRPAEREAKRLARVFDRGVVVEYQNGNVRYRRDASQM